jgi:hypothetical protein
MTDRIELLEAAIDSLPEGFALLHGDSRERGEVALWNQAAAAITVHAGIELVGRVVRASQTATLSELPGKAQSAMPSSFPAGGNRITSASEGAACLPL